MSSTENHSLYYGLGITLLGGAMYYFYRQSDRKLHLLKEAREYSVDKTFLHKVKCDGCLEYAAVIGTIAPNGPAISSLFSQAVGVIHKLTKKEHSASWKHDIGSWVDDSRVLSCDWNHIPFHLTDFSGKSRVYVEDTLQADVIDLQRVYSSYEPNEITLSKAVWNYVNGSQVKGIEVVEEMLCIDSKLTVLGRVTLSNDGRLLITQPELSGTEYIFTTKSLKALRDKELFNTNIQKYAAAFLLCVGSSFILYWMYRVYKKSVEERFVTVDLNPDGSSSCVICFERPRNVVILLCGHVCSCQQCAKMIKTCPVCRGAISKLVPIYIS